MGLHNTRGEHSAIPINSHDLVRMDYLAAIVAVMWAIESITPEEDKFSRGSWKISDTRLADFLKGYYNYANPERVAGISLAQGQITAANNLIYSRDPNNGLSSHYKNDKDQHGVDIRFHPQDDSCFILPPFTDMRSHILFGEISGHKQTTFLKFEMFGLGDYKQFAYHAVEFMHGGDTTASRREKDFPPEYAKLYNDFCSILKITPEKNYQDAMTQVTDIMFGTRDEKSKHGIQGRVSPEASRVYEMMNTGGRDSRIVSGNEVVLTLSNEFPVFREHTTATNVISIEDVMQKLSTEDQLKIYLPALIMRASKAEILSLNKNFLARQSNGTTIAAILYSTEEGKRALCKLLDYAPQLDWPDAALGRQEPTVLGTFFAQGVVVKCCDLQCRDISKKTRLTDLYKAVAYGERDKVGELLDSSFQGYFDNSEVKADTILICAARLGYFGIFSMILDKYTENQQNKTIISINPLSGIREANPSGNETAFNMLISYLDRLDSTNSSVVLPDTYYVAVDTFLTSLKKYPPGAGSFGVTGKRISDSLGTEDAFGMTPIDRIVKSGDIKLLKILDKHGDYFKLFGIDQNKAIKLESMIPSNCQIFKDMFSEGAKRAGITLSGAGRIDAPRRRF